jgi:hypothetical protein
VDRCGNLNSSNYHSYGGKGISVCDEWRGSPVKFDEWALQNGYLQLDRRKTISTTVPIIAGGAPNWNSKTTLDRNGMVRHYRWLTGPGVPASNETPRRLATTLAGRLRRCWRTLKGAEDNP